VDHAFSFRSVDFPPNTIDMKVTKDFLSAGRKVQAMEPEFFRLPKAALVGPYARCRLDWPEFDIPPLIRISEICELTKLLTRTCEWFTMVGEGQ